MICNDVEKLVEPFRSLIKKLMAEIESKGLPFAVYETWRLQKRQDELYKTGKSKILNSKHCQGKACDIVHKINGKWDWSDIKAYQQLGAIVAEYPELTWGGSWKTFKDYDHVELA